MKNEQKKQTGRVLQIYLETVSNVVLQDHGTLISGGGL